MPKHLTEATPIPKPKTGRPRKYPIDTLEIGGDRLLEGVTQRRQISGTIFREKPKRFVTRKEETGLRVWRIE